MKNLKLLMLLLLTGCGRSKTAYETTILVQNWHGNPLANQEVRFYKQNFGNFIDTNLVQRTLRTDAMGKVVFDYEILEDESSTEFATIYVKNQPLFKSLQFVHHLGPSQNRSEKKTWTIQMDSLIGLKIRVVKTDTAQADLRLFFSQPSQPDAGSDLKFRDAYGGGLSIQFVNVGRIDTIIHPLVLKNARSAAFIRWERGNMTIKTETKLVNAQQYRDSLMTIRF